MRITLNGKPEEVSETSVFTLRDRVKPGGYAVVNGYGVSEDVKLEEGMSVCLFLKDEVPSETEWDALLSARESPEVTQKMKRARVGIAGLGGLGSNIAVMLTRAGIGHLLLVDFDTVDVTNLNRQDYVRSDIGKRKTDALKERLLQINPHLEADTVFERVTAKNANRLFKNCDVVVEAFDGASSKTALITAVLSEHPDKWVVSGNGVAGYGPANEITTTMPMRHLVMCGDGRTEAGEGCGLTSPHVTIVAAHEANAVMRIVLGLEPI